MQPGRLTVSAVPIERFLADLFRRDIRVWAEGDRVRCSGPDAALTAETVTGIRERKADIVAFLKAGAITSDAPQTIVRRDDPEPPLSFAQQRLWFVEQMLPGTALHNIPF